MGEDVVQKLIEFVQNASPVVWNAALKQVQVDAVLYFIGAVVFLVLTIGCISLTRWSNNKKKEATDWNESDYDLGIYFGAAGAVLFTLCTVGFICEMVVRLINPTWYAIQNILNLLP